MMLISLRPVSQSLDSFLWGSLVISLTKRLSSDVDISLSHCNIHYISIYFIRVTKSKLYIQHHVVTLKFYEFIQIFTAFKQLGTSCRITIIIIIIILVVYALHSKQSKHFAICCLYGLP